jgi:hypothetical protein
MGLWTAPLRRPEYLVPASLDSCRDGGSHVAGMDDPCSFFRHTKFLFPSVFCGPVSPMLGSRVHMGRFPAPVVRTAPRIEKLPRVCGLERAVRDAQGSAGGRKALRRIVQLKGRARVKAGAAYFDRLDHPDAVPFEPWPSSVTSGGMSQAETAGQKSLSRRLPRPSVALVPLSSGWKPCSGLEPSESRRWPFPPPDSRHKWCPGCNTLQRNAG